MSHDLMIVQYPIIIAQYIIYRIWITNNLFGSRGIMVNQSMGSI